MNKKARKETQRDLRRMDAGGCDAASKLSYLGLNAQLTAELRRFYETSVSEPIPDSLRSLLAQLSRSPAG
ncbi:NepR family anti-sigma factor [Methylocystis sp.]|uniref:NepR family anti-sigma factor n=1 Tax=Methylocystis sp. TaxID=1911079 RepID=UPI0025F580CA|nr:NepR family anti-sigma factor [Methylocystis sp.]